LFLKILDRVRRRYRLVVLGYVVMPEHIHLLVSEPQRETLSTAIQALILGLPGVRSIISTGERFSISSCKKAEAKIPWVQETPGILAPCDQPSSCF
jgi:putative transposase